MRQSLPTSKLWLHSPNTAIRTTLAYTNTDSTVTLPTSTRVANPRQLPLPSTTSAELEPGIGRAQYMGVTYRKDREGTRPWVARCLDRTLGTYKTAFDAAVARWICLRYDRDLVEDGGVWYGQAYQGKEVGNLTIARFTGACEADVIRLIDEHLYATSKCQEAGVFDQPTVPHGDKRIEEHLSGGESAVKFPLNPRHDPALPSELPRTTGRGHYRGVTESNSRYIARWNNTFHLGTYDTAIEAGTTVYIAENYDRDIVSNARGGFKGRAYRKPAKRKPTMESFQADSEAESMHLIDHFHGITGRAVESPATIAVVTLDQAICQFWDELWLRHCNGDGNAVCTELYRMWHMFLARHSFPDLVRVKERAWCCAVDRMAGVQRFHLPYHPDEQAVSVPDDCRLVAKQSKRKQQPLWTQQWKMVMTATCLPDICELAWNRRRAASLRRDVVSRQLVIVREIADRKLLLLRFPSWVDEWVRPPVLSDDELHAALATELARVDRKTLEWWVHLNQDNVAFSHELEKRVSSEE